MDKYMILQRKAFEKTVAFEKRINEQARKGYRAVNLYVGQAGWAVLMEKIS
ncbi:MAG: hypothetical protein JJ975_11410 [Bacteroidia bacterium]|nr:hypothetical protein [Bacteroidia bacterium]